MNAAVAAGTLLPSTALVALVLLVTAVAAGVQAVTGFGFSLVAIPVVTLASDPAQAIVLVTMLSLVLTTAMTVGDRRVVDWPATGRLSAASVAGIPVGLAILTLAPRHLLTILIGIVVIGSTLLLLDTGRRRPGRHLVLGAGFASGSLLTSTGLNGPPLALVLQSLGLRPAAFRATLQATFVSQNVLALAGFALVGEMTTVHVVLAVACVPGVAAGCVVGDRLFNATSPDRLRRLVLTVVGCSGLAAVVRGTLGMFGMPAG